MTTTPRPARLRKIAFSSIPGWAEDDHAAAFAAYRLSAARIVERLPKTKPMGPDGPAMLAAAKAALALDARLTANEARAFFERWFQPRRVYPASGEGFVTGYFEPELDGALTRSDRFPVPIYAVPDDLVELKETDPRDGLDPVLTWARRLPGGGYEEFPDRGAIMAGALGPDAPALAYVANWTEAFFIHVQGSARIRLQEGGVKRLTFAAKSGHPYFAIAKVLVEKGLMAPKDATADVLKRWLLDNPDESNSVMARNRSFIFFREAPVPDPALGPVAAADVPLYPERSLAVDRHLTTFHAPVFIETELGSGAFRHLMMAQDTGSAILGPARGDIFFGTGEAAWQRAAKVRHPARFTIFFPRVPHDGA